MLDLTALGYADALSHRIRRAVSAHRARYNVQPNVVYVGSKDWLRLNSEAESMIGLDTHALIRHGETRLFGLLVEEDADIAEGCWALRYSADDLGKEKAAP